MSPHMDPCPAGTESAGPDLVFQATGPDLVPQTAGPGRLSAASAPLCVEAAAMFAHDSVLRAAAG